VPRLSNWLASAVSAHVQDGVIKAMRDDDPEEVLRVTQQ